MKKRAAAKKPSARKSAAKKQAKPAAASKSAKPAKMVARPAGTADRAGVGKYTPTPIQGIGWAPFRYPL